MNKYIAWLTSILVFLVALGSFVLSYNALYDVAIQNGIAPKLAFIWPLLVDFSLVVFSLAVVTAHLYSESTRKQWLLVAIYTIATVLFNCLHAPDNLLARVIATVPPVSLFFSFELLMQQLKNSIDRKQEQAIVAGYDTALQQAQNGFADLMRQIEAVKAEHIAAIADKNNQLAEMQQQLDVARDPVAHRRNNVLSLIQQYRAENGKEPTQVYLAEQTGVSVQTIRADVMALNGRAK